MNTLEQSSEEASAIAVHKAASLQQATETARELQLQDIIEESARRTEASILKGLKEVFGDSDSEDPQKMKVLVRRIPILCTSVMKMHDDLSEIKGNIKWAMRLFISGIGTIIIALIISAITGHTKV